MMIIMRRLRRSKKGGGGRGEGRGEVGERESTRYSKEVTQHGSDITGVQ